MWNKIKRIDDYSVNEITKEEVMPWILKRHYAKSKVFVSHSFGLFYRDNLVGICVFGPSPNPTMQKIGIYIVYELKRLVIEDGNHKDAGSVFVSRALKFMPSPSIIVSYADIGRRHIGYIYQATNWIYTGRISARPRWYKNGKAYHTRSLYDKLGTNRREVFKAHGYIETKDAGKHRYFYFIGSKKQKRDMYESLPFKIIEDYPKGENERYDASAAIFKPSRHDLFGRISRGSEQKSRLDSRIKIRKK
jgi:hypothetical protein